MRIGIAAARGLAEQFAQLSRLIGIAEVAGLEQGECCAHFLALAGAARRIEGHRESDDARALGFELVDQASVNIARPGPFAQLRQAGIVDGDDGDFAGRGSLDRVHHAVVQAEFQRQRGGRIDPLADGNHEGCCKPTGKPGKSRQFCRHGTVTAVKVRREYSEGR